MGVAIMLGTRDLLFSLRTVGFGALAGMRSMSPPAMLSLYLGRERARNNLPAQLASSRRAQVILSALAAGEIIADKFPQAPDRVFAPALVGRAVTAGGTSGLLWSLNRRPAWLGVLLGAGAALASTFATFRLRLWLGRVLPGRYAVSWAGLLEDAVVWVGGYLLLHGQARNAERRATNHVPAQVEQ